MKQIKETLKPKLNILKLSFSYMDYPDSQFQVSQMLLLIYRTLASVLLMNALRSGVIFLCLAIKISSWINIYFNINYLSVTVTRIKDMRRG